ncbi:MAG: hypothetical protein H7840_17660 [Alphaproteobacteria bacterium]
MGNEAMFFDRLFMKLMDPMHCRKLAVVEAIFRNPRGTDKEIAHAAFCSVKTVKKWRPFAIGAALVCRDNINGSTFTVRLKEGVLR